MRFLHTADVHLQGEAELPIVKVLVETAVKENCEAILISGDFFDHQHAHLDSLSGLVPVLSAFPGTVFILPGNHDAELLARTSPLSSNTVILAAGGKLERRMLGDIELLAIPFQAGKSMQDYQDLKADPDRSVLMVHGNYYTDEFFYEGESKRYFPIFDQDLRGRFKYVALGHYHRWFEKKLGTTVVINPGSPRVTRTSDIGPRMAAVVDTAGWSVRQVQLPVPFYQEYHLVVTTRDDEKSVLEKLSALQKTQTAPGERRILKISGLTADTLPPYRLEELAGKAFEKTDTTGLKLLDTDLLNHPFVCELLDALEGRVPPEQAEEARRFALERLQFIVS